MHDQRQVAAIEGQVAGRQRGEIAARGVERRPTASGPCFDPRVRRPLLPRAPQTEPADEARRHARCLEERGERPCPAEARAPPGRQHRDGVLGSGRVCGREEGRGVLVERPDHLVEACRAADDALRPPLHLGCVALDARRRRERCLTFGRRRHGGDRLGRDGRRRRLGDADREVVRHRRRRGLLGRPLCAQVGCCRALAELEARSHRPPAEHVLPAIGERHQDTDTDGTLRRRDAKREPEVPVGERRASGHRPLCGLLPAGEHLGLVAGMRRLLRARPGRRRCERRAENGRAQDPTREHER